MTGFGQKNKIRLLTVLLLALNGCFLNGVVDKKEGAVVLIPASDRGPSSFSGGSSSCGVYGFSISAHPAIVQNCASCHAGGGPGPSNFASSDPGGAYSSARSRVNLGSPNASLLVTKSSKAGHGGNCSVCGTAWGSTLTSLIGEWAKAENNDPVICANNPAPDSGGDSGGGGSGPFNDGVYNPGSGVDTEIIALGLSEYAKSGGIQSFLNQNCVSCHVPGGDASSAAFAVPDSVESYLAAKLRVNFQIPENSKLIGRISDPNHGDGGCLACGIDTNINQLLGMIPAWAAAEVSGVQAAHVNISSKLIGAGAGPVNLTWDLGAVNADMAGAEFSVTATKLTDFVYEFKNPRISTGARTIRIKEIYFIVNGSLNPFLATFSRVDATILANTALANILISQSTPVPIGDINTDTVGFSFAILRAE